MKTVIAIVCAVFSLFGAELIIYEENADKDQAINLVIVAEGYTASEKATFQQDITTFSNAIFSDPMMAAYRSYHNIYGVFVASNQSGADDPNGGVTRDTYFDAKYNTAGIDRLLTCNSSRVQQVVNSVIPEADAIMVSVNYQKYGGSGGAIATSSSGAPEIAAHEIGHSFVGLKDEYDYTANYIPYEGINATAKTTWATIRWNYWIDQSTPLPTPETSQWGSTVGIFEGANYQATGWYRPQLNCRMKSNGRDLCAVCAEAWLLQIYDLVSPIKTSSHPSGSSVTLDGTNELTVEVHNSTDATVVTEWYIDGEMVATGSSLSQLAKNGTYTVKAIVRDTTALVREDPSGLLVDSLQWSVTYTGGVAVDSDAVALKSGLTLHDGVLHLQGDRRNLQAVKLFSLQGKLLWNQDFSGRTVSVALPQSLARGYHILQVNHNNRVETRQILLP